MMTSFKARFVVFVEEGSKRHTLRDIRKGERQFRAGDRVDAYANARQKNMRLIGRWPCTRVETARFELHEDRGPVMSIGDVELTPNEADAFAWRDGFRHLENCPGTDGQLKTVSDRQKFCFAMMMKYWIDEGKSFPFEKQLIHWDYNRPMEKPKPKKRQPPLTESQRLSRALSRRSRHR